MPLALPVQILHYLPSFLGGIDKQAKYSQLPVSRTSTFDSITDSEVSEDGAPLRKTESLCYRHHKAVLAAAGVLTAAALTAVVVALPVQKEICPVEQLYNDVGAWYRHPSAYKGERIRSRQDEPLEPTFAQRALSQSCTDLWISKGQLCEEAKATKALPDVETDVVWTFVEPTDHWRIWKAAYKGVKETGAEETAQQQAEKLVHFRSYDEIRYSVRSVAKNLPFMRKKILLATSLSEPLPHENATVASFSEYKPKQCRVAQIPEWLSAQNSSMQPNEDAGVDDELQVLPHWELFDGRSESPDAMHAAKAAILPTFNSHAIESQLYNLPDAAPSVLYLNNDVYIGREMGPSDLSTHLLGPVYRIYPVAFSHGAASLEEAMKIDGEGNGRVMPNTVRLLDQRFGRRDRNYADHTGHVLSTAMTQEISRVWSKELHETSQVRFRGAGPEVWLPLLAMYYLVEKQREVLLWSFIVATSDRDSSGFIDEKEHKRMLDTMGGRIDGDNYVFPTPNRPPNHLALAELATSAGGTMPKETEYGWTSMDGYPYASREGGNHVFPTYDGQGDFCSVSLSDCFPVPAGDADDTRASHIEASELEASELFKRVAFEQPRCGDCLIAGLLAKSGESGLKAFLPDVETQEQSDLDTQAVVPQLGEARSTWQEVDFSLSSALNLSGSGRWTKRDFVVRLLQRYSYTFGTSSLRAQGGCTTLTT